MSSQRLDKEVAAWLATVLAERGDTIAEGLGETIVPTSGHDTASARALAILTRIGRDSGDAVRAKLRLADTIGEGGMGIVHLAEQVALGRKVAVKTLRPESKSKSATMELLREAWVTGTLEHPNVVPIYDISLDEDGCPLVVLKRIEGVVWSDLIDADDIICERFGHQDSLAWNIDILMAVLNAVRFAHSRGIIHRDLKPANVMIGEFGEVYLLDWGIAVSLVDDPSGRMPVVGDDSTMAGTPCYMAPEMLGNDSLPLSQRTDVYLAGAILYEILTGAPPHLADSALEVIASVAASNPTMPDEAPTELARICRQAMAANPDERFASADELRQALRDYLEHRGSEHLAGEAEQRRLALASGLSSATSDDPDQRDDLYRLFGECRFGFHEALSAWPGNVSARAGLVGASCAMAEYELAHDDPRAAATLIADLEEAPTELRQRIDLALARLDAERKRHAELEELGQQLDITTGTRTRMFLSFVLGLAFTTSPLAGLVWSDAHLEEPANMLRASVGFLVIIVSLGFWARESMSKTLVNQRVFAALLSVMVVHVFQHTAAMLLNLDPVTNQVMVILVWACFAIMATIAIDLRLLPCALGFLCAFLLAARWPQHRLVAMSASNLVFTINAVVIWRPQSLAYSAEERAARQLGSDT